MHQVKGMKTLSLGVSYLDRLVPRSAGKVTGGALFWTLITNKSCLFFSPFLFFKWWKSLFRHQFVSDSLRPHGWQQVRLPYPSPSPGVCPSLCLLNWWCHPTISSSVTLFALNLSQHQSLFQWVSSSHQVAIVLEFQLQHQSFQWVFGVDFLYDWLAWSPCSPRDSQESSPTPQLKSINSSVLSFFHSPTLASIHDHGITSVLLNYIYLNFFWLCYVAC